MDLNKIEHPAINEDKSKESRKEISSVYKTIFKLAIVLALTIGLFAGLVLGYFATKAIYEELIVELVKDQDDSNDSIQSMFDYSKFNINSTVTIEDYYDDDEEKYIAMQLIGTTLPELKYIDAEGKEYSTSDLETDRFILEFIEPDCAFCNKTIEVVDEYMKTESQIPVIGLSIKDGNIDNFNKNGEHTFMLIQKDDQTNKLVESVAWVPTFMYVENGQIKLVTFGKINSLEDFEKHIETAFENK